MADKGSDSNESSASLPKRSKNITEIIKDLAEDEVDGNTDKIIESMKKIGLGLELFQV